MAINPYSPFPCAFKFASLRKIDRFVTLANVGEAAACWNWLGHVDKRHGYGKSNLVIAGQRVQQRAHRVAWLFANGWLPKFPALCLDHLCRNRACVNPSHLEVVTLAENTERGIPGERRRRNACNRGHALTPENTIAKPKGRGCRRCAYDANNRWQKAHRVRRGGRQHA